MSIQERQYMRSIGAYLEQEVNTKQAWIDKRPIYRKVLDFGALPNNTTKSLAHGVSGYDLISLRAISSNGTTRIPIPFTNAAATTIASIESNATNVIIGTNTNLTAFTETYIIMEYAKQ